MLIDWHAAWVVITLVCYLVGLLPCCLIAMLLGYDADLLSGSLVV